MGDRHLRTAIQGMTCPRCEQHVTHALTQAGASGVTASSRRREALFRCDANADVKPLIEAVQEAGYQPGIVEEGEREWLIAPHVAAHRRPSIAIPIAETVR